MLQFQLTRDHLPALGKAASIQVEAIATQTKSNDEMKVQIHPPLGDQPVDLLTLAAPAHARDYRTVTKKNIGKPARRHHAVEYTSEQELIRVWRPGGGEIEECFLVVEYTLQLYGTQELSTT